MANNINSISIASRASSLATIQAKMVGDRIKEILPYLSIRYHTIKTNADLNVNINISDPSEIGIFNKDSTRVIDGECDLAVHSKDLPIEPSNKQKQLVLWKRGYERCNYHEIKSSISRVQKDIKILTSSPRRV